MSAFRELREGVQALVSGVRGLFTAMRDPQAHAQRVQAEAQAHDEHKLPAAWALEVTPKPVEEIRHFQTLAEALDWIATCLETDAITDLAEEMEGLETLLERVPGWGLIFRKCFAALKEIHLSKDLRQIYKAREFPNDESCLELGATSGELEHKALWFSKRDRGWVLVEITMYR